MAGESIRVGSTPTLQFHPTSRKYELVGSKYPLFDEDAVRFEPITKTYCLHAGNTRLILLHTKQLGKLHQTVRFLGAFED